MKLQDIKEQAFFMEVEDKQPDNAETNKAIRVNEIKLS